MKSDLEKFGLVEDEAEAAIEDVVEVAIEDEVEDETDVAAEDACHVQEIFDADILDAKKFADNWNLKHRNLKLTVIEGSTIGRPIQIEVRFSRSKFREICNAVSFVRFRQEVERRSRRTMFVTESEYLFENGIIEIKIAALASNYDPKVIIGVLHWMVAVFFAL